MHPDEYEAGIEDAYGAMRCEAAILSPTDKRQCLLEDGHDGSHEFPEKRMRKHLVSVDAFIEDVLG